MIEISPSDMQTIIAAFVALISALIAVWQNSQKKTIEQAYTPGTAASNDPAVVATLPARSWKMDAATIRWLTFDATPENKVTILNQIAMAEAQKLTSYQIVFDGGYYDIDYGLLKGSAGNPSGIKTN